MKGKSAQGMTTILALLGAGIGISAAQADVMPGPSTGNPGAIQTAQARVPTPDSRQIKIDGVMAPNPRQPQIEAAKPLESNQIKWEDSPQVAPNPHKLNR